MPENAPDPGKADGDDAFHFLTEYDTCDLIYELENPFGLEVKARLDVLGRFEPKPLWSLDLVKLGPTWLRHGVHTVKWDGRIVKGDAELKGTDDGDGTKHDLTGQAPHANRAGDAAFPDGWVTLEHTPYKLRLVIESDALPNGEAIAWTYFQVLLKKLEISLGEEKMVPKGTSTNRRWARDKAIRKAIADAGGVPADGAAAARPIVLTHNVFKMTGTDMYPNQGPPNGLAGAPGPSVGGNDVYFNESQKFWEDGPRIPLLCKIWMSEAADSGGGIDVSAAGTKGAVALGRTRFMWEWEFQDESLASQTLKPLAFLTDAINFDKEKTGPKGNNCHVDRGGKRGPKAKPVFPQQPGYKPRAALKDGVFPFRVAKQRADGAAAPPANKPPPFETEKRLWATYSHPWTMGAKKGFTGAVFSPSRMAGDIYIVRVTLANELDTRSHLRVDNTDQPLSAAARITAKTGPWEVRHKLKIARYIRKMAVIGDFLSAANLATIRTAFKGPYVDVDAPDGAEKYLITNHNDAAGAAIVYNTIANAAVAGSGAVLLTGNIVIAPGADHGATASAFETRNYKQFVQALHEFTYSTAPAVATDFTVYAAANATTADAVRGSLATLAIVGATPVAARLTGTQAWLNTNGCTNAADYCTKADEWLDPALDALFDGLKTISGGNAKRPAEAGITILEFDQSHSAGRRLMATGVGYKRTVGLAHDVADRRREACCFIFYQQDVKTFCHEIGHHLCLPHHNFGTPGNLPDGAVAALHDADDTMCLMTYSTGTSVFCGFCQLRIRGWAARALSSTDATNKRT